MSPVSKKQKDYDVYTKDNPKVIQNNKKTHSEFIENMRSNMSEIGYSELAKRVGVDSPQVTRLFKPGENVTIMSMNRFALAIGKRVKIEFVDPDNID